MGDGHSAVEVQCNCSVQTAVDLGPGGWLQHRAQEEEYTPRARERDQWLGKVGVGWVSVGDRLRVGWVSVG